MTRQHRQLAWARRLIGLAVVLLAALVGRLGWLTTHPHPIIQEKAESQYRLTQPLLPRRGLIVDCMGRPLAGTVERKSIFADPYLLDTFNKDIGPVAARVAAAANLHPATLTQEFREAAAKRFIWLKRFAEPAETRAVEQLKIYGVGLIPETERTYPMGSVAAHILGFVGADGQGLEGLELAHEKTLAGKPGYKIVVSDAARRAISISRDDYRPPTDGSHLVLTLDSAIQANTEEVLKQACRDYQAAGGVAAVMDPSTGEILAWANWPTYDPGRFREAASEQRRNRLITDPYEPGSIFKPMVVAVGIECGAITAERTFNTDQNVFGRRRIREHGGHTYGVLSVRDILSKSSNVGMAHIGCTLGNERLYQGLRSLGFGEQTGIELPGEDPGILHPLSRWNTPYTTTSVPMGQEVGITSLQLLRAVAAIANGGTLLKPRIVRGIIDPHGEVITDNSRPVAVGKVLSERTCRIMIDMLREVVVSGTGGKAALDGYQVFGKTGTAQVARRGGGGYEPDAYVGSFVGGAPAENPRIVAIVSIFRPNRRLGYYGGTVAAPAVAKIIDHALRYLQVPPAPPSEDPPRLVRS